jgi:hypothetical protein
MILKEPIQYHNINKDCKFYEFLRMKYIKGIADCFVIYLSCMFFVAVSRLDIVLKEYYIYRSLIS